MKIKSIVLIGLIFLSLLSVTALYAETTKVGDSTFTIPEGYKVSSTENSQVVLTDGENAITLYEGPVIDVEEAKTKRISSGYDFIGDRTYDVDSISINQQNYNKDGVNSCVYTFDKNGKSYIITFNLDENATIPEYEKNPVTGIINSLN